MKAVLGKYRVKDESGYLGANQISSLQGKLEFILQELDSVGFIIVEAE